MKSTNYKIKGNLVIDYENDIIYPFKELGAWLTDALKFIKEYNTTPKSKRKKLYQDKYPIEEAFYRAGDSISSNVRETTYIEAVPEDAKDFRHIKGYDLRLVLKAVTYYSEDGKIFKTRYDRLINILPMDEYRGLVDFWRKLK